MTSSFDWDTFIARSLVADDIADLETDQRWSTWPETAHTMDRGPQPFPEWVVQFDGALDTELGMLKTGKEADAFLIERALPESDRTGAPGEAVLLVAKRYRSSEHTTFHRSHEYTLGRSGRDSREARALAKKTEFGKKIAADRWARAEFDILGRLWSAGLAVPYPVQIVGTELLMEFIGTDDAGGAVAAPRLQETRPDAETAQRWARALREFVLDLAGLGLAHGDLSPYNILISPEDEPVVIDVPQVVDLIANVNGPEFLHRDCVNVCTWLRAHGAPDSAADAGEWFEAARSAQSAIPLPGAP